MYQPTVNKFKEGETVFELTRPSQKLVVARIYGGVYYCSVKGQAKRMKLVFSERELKSNDEVPK
ncbi:MAG: hypothetical protein MUF68_06275 [Cyclobacteriaceae bacterium]|nr:hypothetical protein [Cyclobacteriaceae bacterium]